MKQLHLYIYSAWRAAVAVILLAMLALFLLFTLTGELGDVHEHYSVANAVAGTLLRLPYFLQVLLPMAVLTGSCIALVQLARRGELAAIISAGMRPSRIAGVLLLRGWLPLMLLAACNNELLVPWAQRMVWSLEQNPASLQLPVSHWLHDGDTHISIGRAGAYGYLEDLSFFTYDRQQPRQLRQFTHARYAVYRDGGWQMFQITERGTEESQQEVSTTQRNWHTSLAPEVFATTAGSDVGRPLPELWRHAMHTSRSEHINAFWQRVSYPLLLALMLLLGVILVPADSKNYTPVAKAVVLLMLYFMLRRISGHGAFADLAAPWLLAAAPLALLAIATATLYSSNRN